jgi:hypothetical protein
VRAPVFLRFAENVWHLRRHPPRAALPDQDVRVAQKSAAPRRIREYIAGRAL